MSSALLHTQNLTIGHPKDGHPLARNLNLSIERGQLICLLGPNGAGKSTLLRTLNGLQKPFAGAVWLDGQLLSKLDPTQRAKLVAVVLTERVQMGWATVQEVVTLGRFPHQAGWHARPTPTDHAMVASALQAVHIEKLATRYFQELSDGERQKVMIARAIAQQPSLLIMDEPTAFVDWLRRLEIMQLAQRLAHDCTCAVLMSTHDLELALRFADWVWLLDEDGQLSVHTPLQLVDSNDLQRAFPSSVPEELTRLLAHIGMNRNAG
ncbi:MAG TPA: ABC transporter ATP-binding protein [Anaerolineales bacterium]|nr:ABC transporter ATP-binding protein [Anaerolineales bacterium]